MKKIVGLQLLLLVLGWGSGWVYAQSKGFVAGYILTKNGDTLNGFIKDRYPEPFVSLYDKLRFRQKEKSRTKKFSPDAILGYGFANEHYISMRLREESNFFKFRYYTDATAPKVFLRVQKRTPKLWYLEQLYLDDDNAYLDTIPFFYKPGSRELVRVTQGIFGFKKKRLMAYFYDCPAVVQALSKEKVELQGILELYNFCVANCF